MGEEERLSAVREIWRKTCDGLEPQQQEAPGGDGSTAVCAGESGCCRPEAPPEKCHFVRREVRFLGHKLGAEGISTMEDKVQAVREWPTPTDQQQLKSFLGLASYYRRFVQGFCCTAAPLYHLLQKDKAFTWTEVCQEAFSSLQGALTEAPTLAPPDPSLPFVLDTDASNVGMGAVLAQVGPEGERVVAYYSRTFDKADYHYCVTRRELLAVVLAIRHFKHYLYGCHYCEWREARESELCAEGEACAVGHKAREPVYRALQAVDTDEWQLQQEQDIDLRPMLQWVEARQRPLWEEVAALWSKFGALRMKDGVLERAFRAPATGEEWWQVVVPKEGDSA
ncbi:hypothetical protein SKAU_G00342250 [Synaphobranchus kaupii]|uniref:Reverse transcriptase/retrotransposon-derived protein RNase H-like domain-containing protein n=1 Tax=Synaphobranchus kaupii TaxID=118154 RepID=A0A9Q1ENB7_SYNKA|nr:hypothetical protein SKAU_G00342250 [Synaphobranchus kaupii]